MDKQQAAVFTHIEALKNAKEVLQWMSDKMSVDHPRDLQDSHDRPLNAIRAIELALEKAPAPPAAGPVWVKASKDHLPLPHIEVCIRYPDGDNFQLIIGNRRMVKSLIDRGYTGIEFLSETTQAKEVFTREQVEKALRDGAAFGVFCHHPEMLEERCNEYVNTNYPLPPSPSTEQSNPTQ